MRSLNPFLLLSISASLSLPVIVIDPPFSIHVIYILPISVSKLIGVSCSVGMLSFLGPGQQYTDYLQSKQLYSLVNKSWLISNNPRLLPFFDTPTSVIGPKTITFLHVLITSGRSATMVRHAIGISSRHTSPNPNGARTKARTRRIIISSAHPVLSPNHFGDIDPILITVHKRMGFNYTACIAEYLTETDSS